jgi:heme A synthase
MLHRAFAFLVFALVVWSSLRLVRVGSGMVRLLAWAAPVLVLLQMALGVLTITTFKDLVPVTAHLLVAALLLADSVALLALTRRAPEYERAPAALGVAT